MQEAATVLVADDDDIAHLVRDYLEVDGNTVVTANDGRAAIEAVSRRGR